MVTLTQLEYILAVQKHGHFGRAAQACHVSQPSLSQQIQKLEEDLGIVLFDRSKKPILLTDAGRRLIEQARVILTEVRKFEDFATTGKSGVVGELNLGVIPTVAPYVLPLFLPTLSNNHQGIQLKVHEMQTHAIIEALERDELDVGLLATPLNIPQIEEYALFFEPFYLYAAQEHPLAKRRSVGRDDLTRNDIWLLSEGHCLREQVIDLCSLKKDACVLKNVAFESGSLETLKRLIRDVGGYTLMPALAVNTNDHEAGIIIRPFERPIPSREIGLVYRRKQYKMSAIEELGQVIIECIPPEIRKLRKKDLRVLEVEA